MIFLIIPAIKECFLLITAKETNLFLARYSGDLMDKEYGDFIDANAVNKNLNDQRFEMLTESEREQLRTIVSKIKVDQLKSLEVNLKVIMEMLYDACDKDAGSFVKLLDIATFSSPKEITSAIKEQSAELPARINEEEQIVDQQLLEALNEFSDSSAVDDYYEILYHLRHDYFFSKPTGLNIYDMPISIIDKLLKRGHTDISAYLKGGESILTAEEKKLITSLYPTDEIIDLIYVEKKAAQKVIQLTPKEVEKAVLSHFEHAKKNCVSLFEDEGVIKKADTVTDWYRGEISQEEAEKQRGLLDFKRFKINIRSALTPLHFAAPAGHLKTIERLIKQGADVNARDYFGQTPLFLATRVGNVAAMRTLINHGAKFNIRDTDNGTTPIFYAIHSNKLSPVTLLLDLGADINAKDDFGNSPLTHALSSGNLDIIDLILRRDGEFHSTFYKSPLFACVTNATFSGHSDYASNIETFIECFLNHGTDPNIKNKSDQTVLFDIINTFDYPSDLLDLLCEYGLDFDLKDNLERTPLYFSVEVDSFEAVRCLVKKGAKISELGPGCETPLHLAIKQLNVDMANLFMDTLDPVELKKIINSKHSEKEGFFGSPTFMPLLEKACDTDPRFKAIKEKVELKLQQTTHQPKTPKKSLN